MFKHTIAAFVGVMFCNPAFATLAVDCYLTDVSASKTEWVGTALLTTEFTIDHHISRTVGKFSVVADIHLARGGSGGSDESKAVASILNEKGQTLAAVTAGVFDYGTSRFDLDAYTDGKKIANFYCAHVW